MKQKEINIFVIYQKILDNKLLLLLFLFFFAILGFLFSLSLNSSSESQIHIKREIHGAGDIARYENNDLFNEVYNRKNFENWKQENTLSVLSFDHISEIMKVESFFFANEKKVFNTIIDASTNEFFIIYTLPKGEPKNVIEFHKYLEYINEVATIKYFEKLEKMKFELQQDETSKNLKGYSQLLSAIYDIKFGQKRLYDIKHPTFPKSGDFTKWIGIFTLIGFFIGIMIILLKDSWLEFINSAEKQ